MSEETKQRVLTAEEIEYLKTYNPNSFERPVGVPADIVIFTITSEKKHTIVKSYPERELKILLIKRNNVIQRGKWALPGGFSNPSETLLEAAKRELKEETGVEDIHIEQFGIYDTPKRDPRGWVISSAYLAFVHEIYLEKRKAADDADDCQLFTIEEALNLDLAFDHDRIIKDALSVVRKKMKTTNIAKEFLPEEFTLEELRRVLICVCPEFDEDKGNFHKKMKNTQRRNGIIEMVYQQNGLPKKSNENSNAHTQLFKFSNYVPELSIYS